MNHGSGANAQLIVEGKDDQHVIWALCQQYRVPKTFEVIELGGIEAILKGIPVRLKRRGLQSLGVVIDANQNIQARWDSIRGRLETAGYSVPSQPDLDGFIASPSRRPRVGVWLMPDNQLSGMLEDFVSYLISPSDPLKPIAEETLQSIEEKGLTRYRPTHRPKAFIHTWLAWQETPGMPMGQAITAQVLQSDHPLASRFVNWLNRVFA